MDEKLRWNVFVGWGCRHNAAKWSKWEQELEKKGWEHAGMQAYVMRRKIQAVSAEAAEGVAISDLDQLRGLETLERCPMCYDKDFYLSHSEAN